MADDLIQPAAGAAAPVEIIPTEQEAPASQGAEIPDELLRLPSMGPLLAGSPPALSLKIKDMEKTEDGKLIATNFKALQGAGIFAYRALDKTTGVLGNSLYIAPEAVKQADEAGQLTSVAPDWNMVGGEASRAGAANPVMTAAEVPAGPASGRLPSPPASAQTSLAKSRAKNLQEGSATSGRAAQGRLLNNLLKPAI